MPGSTPATSQLDWLSSTTAMIVLSWSKATRDLLKSFSWGIGALRQLFASDDGAISFAACPIPSLRWRETDLRQWRGHTHTVLVREDGFEYDGQRYRSLTVIAERITGAHWSGPRFFGLGKRARAC